MSRRLLQMHRACQGSPVVLLANRVIDLGGVRFVGTTLWTDFALDGVPFQSIAMNPARDFMSDFSTVFYRRVLCNPRGYPKSPNSGFIPDLVVEVSA